MHWRIERLLRHGRTYHQRLRRARWRLRSTRFPRDPNGSFLFHIGCGDIYLPGFVNIDARRREHVHIVSKRLFDLSVIPDNVASMIYMCHVLEHVPYADVQKVLREMKRILLPGGTLRISVPDFELILAVFEANSRDPDLIAAPLLGGQDYKFNFHFSIFSRLNLTTALAAAGFVDVRAWNPGSCAHHELEDWASRPISVGGKDYPISLNLEASLRVVG